MNQRPAADEYAPFYTGYVASVPDGSIVDAAHASGVAMHELLSSIPESRARHRYAEGKWSIAEMIGHIIDTERVFAYRLLRVARGDATPLPGFEQDAFVAGAASEQRTIAELRAEMHCVRESTLHLLRSLPADAWTRRGTASDNPVTARALAWILTGHALHHVRVLRERYLAS